MGTRKNRLDSFRTGAIQLRIFDSFDEVAHLRDEWDTFVEEAGGYLYMSFDWCRVWWDHYGDHRKLQIYIFRSNGHLVGVLPMFIEQLRLGPVGLRIAKLIGADYSLNLCDPVVTPAHSKDVFKHLISDLIHRERCDAISLSPVSAQCRWLVDAQSVFSEDLARYYRSVIRIMATQTFFPVPDTVEGYLKSLSKNKRSHLRSQKRDLERNHRIEVEVISDPQEGAEEFGRFCQMHGAQWQAQRRLGHFEDWYRSKEFNAELVRSHSRLGRLRMLRIVADGEPVARFYGYVFGKSLYSRFSARAIGPKWDRYGLGNIGTYEKMKLALSEGLTEIKSGLGHYDYKLQWGAQERPVRSFLITATRGWTRFRVAMFCWLAELLHLLYYRIWYLRLAPKLPLARRPLWRIWIRSRI